MAIYTVHAPRGAHAASANAAERVIFVRDGFAWLAFVVPLLWALMHRMWLVFLGILAVSVAIGLAGEFIPWLGNALLGVGLLFSLLVGFEASQLRRWSLDRKGYVMLATVIADNVAGAEQRFFEAWVGQPVSASTEAANWPPVAPARATQTPGATREITGLFPEAGR